MATRHNTRFVTFEGLDGSGKSTLLLKLQTYFQNRNVRCVFTREPGGTPVGEQIRNVILGSEMNPWTELFLYEAARVEHLEEIIRPALAKGDHVFCDRFTHSSLAFQGFGRGLGYETVQKLNKIATQGTTPDAVVYLRLPVKAAIERMDLRGEKTRFDREKQKFHQTIHKAFEQLVRREPRRFIVLDAAQSPDDVFAELLAHRLWKRLFPK